VIVLLREGRCRRAIASVRPEEVIDSSEPSALAIALNGDSYPIKDRDLGRVPSAATDER
jgi:hypothetical protein